MRIKAKTGGKMIISVEKYDIKTNAKMWITNKNSNNKIETQNRKQKYPRFNDCEP